MEAQKFATCDENMVKNIGRKSDVEDLFWHFWVHTSRMDAHRHNNKQCCSIRRYSHEVTHKHQKLLEKKIKHRNRTVARRPHMVGLTVDIDNAEIWSSHTSSVQPGSWPMWLWNLWPYRICSAFTHFFSIWLFVFLLTFFFETSYTLKNVPPSWSNSSK